MTQAAVIIPVTSVLATQNNQLSEKAALVAAKLKPGVEALGADETADA